MLVKLMNGIASMNLGNGEYSDNSYSDNSIDAFGDAYEYLMGMYASNAGKSGGEYYTPQEVLLLPMNQFELFKPVMDSHFGISFSISS